MGDLYLGFWQYFYYLATVMYSMTDLQFQAVYNVLSFSLASMSATTMYLWFRANAVHDKYKSAVYLGPCDFHRRLSLHPYLQFVGRCLLLRGSSTGRGS